MIKLNTFSFNSLANTNSSNTSIKPVGVTKQYVVPFEQNDYFKLFTKDDSNDQNSERTPENKVGTAMTSLVIPGSGQFIKGENYKAAAMFSGSMTLFLLSGITKHPKTYTAAGSAVHGYSAYDAYKD